MGNARHTWEALALQGKMVSHKKIPLAPAWKRLEGGKVPDEAHLGDWMWLGGKHWPTVEMGWLDMDLGPDGGKQGYRIALVGQDVPAEVLTHYILVPRPDPPK